MIPHLIPHLIPFMQELHKFQREEYQGAIKAIVTHCNTRFSIVLLVARSLRASKSALRSMVESEGTSTASALVVQESKGERRWRTNSQPGPGRVEYAHRPP